MKYFYKSHPLIQVYYKSWQRRTTNYDSLAYQKFRQRVVQNITTVCFTNYNKVLTNCDRYYKLRQTYKLRQNTVPFNVLALLILKTNNSSPNSYLALSTWDELLSFDTMFCLFVQWRIQGRGSRSSKLKPEGPKTIWMTGPPPLPEGLDPPLFVCHFFQSSLRKKQPLRIASNCGSYHGHTIVFGYVLTPFSLSTEQLGLIMIAPSRYSSVAVEI